MPRGWMVVGHNVAVIAERFFAKGANAVLCGDLPVEQFSYLAVGTEFPVSSGMLRVLDAANAHLALASFSLDSLPATAGDGAMDRA